MDFFKIFFDTQTLLDTLMGTIWDVLPIAVLILAFQYLVIRRPLPHPRKILLGFVYVLLGLAFFLEGLEMALFPLGKLMAQQLTSPEFIYGAGAAVPESVRWQDYIWVYLFGTAIGFSCVIAEPALIAVSYKAEAVSGGAIRSLGLRVAVAIGAAAGVTLGTFRIVTGMPLHYFIIAGYVVVIIQTIFAPRLISALAYDSGGVTTSTVTVPVVAALGLGLATTIPGRSPLLDGFGIIALTALFPIITVLAYGQISHWLARRNALVDTPLHRAVFDGDKARVERLVAQGDDINARGRTGGTPLHDAAFKGNLPVVELLLAHGAKINAKNQDGRTPLHRAAFAGRRDVAETLIRHGAKVGARNAEGRTPLHRAAFKGHVDVAELLIDRGADVNARTKDGSTPLHRAAVGGHWAAAKRLIECGADINAKNKSGRTPMDEAAAHGQKRFLKDLSEASVRRPFPADEK